jgi:hypothetical protein
MEGEYHGAQTNNVVSQYQQGGAMNGNTAVGTPRGSNSQWVYFGTNDAYNGHVIQVGEDWFTTKGGTIEGNRKQVERRK